MTFSLQATTKISLETSSTNFNNLADEDLSISLSMPGRQTFRFSLPTLVKLGFPCLIIQEIIQKPPGYNFWFVSPSGHLLLVYFSGFFLLLFSRLKDFFPDQYVQTSRFLLFIYFYIARFFNSLQYNLQFFSPNFQFRVVGLFASSFYITQFLSSISYQIRRFFIQVASLPDILHFVGIASKKEDDYNGLPQLEICLSLVRVLLFII